jgi:regulatory protein SWI6
MTQKQTALNVVEQSVRQATRSLAERRIQVAALQATIADLEQAQFRMENMREAITNLGQEDWTGRASSGAEMTIPAFKHLDDYAAPIIPSSPNGDDVTGLAIPIPGTVVQLRRLAMWEDRMADILRARMEALEGEGADKAAKYRKLVSLCTKVPVDKVDSVSGWLGWVLVLGQGEVTLTRRVDA